MQRPTCPLNKCGRLLSAGRPDFAAADRASAESFFLDSLDEWRRAQGLSRFVLVGHSLGGYLAASYALRHPEHVSHLVLVGPAGVVRIWHA
jgi:abhydrolase domain-containing protein 5